MDTLEVWYERVDANAALRTIGRRTPAPVRSAVVGARRQTSRAALPKLTVRTDGGKREIADHPPLVSHDGIDKQAQVVHDVLAKYRVSLEFDRRALLERFELVDLALKVVGVGSVGTRCFVALFESDIGDPLFLQVKEAGKSLVAAYVPRRPAGSSTARGSAPNVPATASSGGRRVVGGQRLMQAASDIFLGWTKGLDTTRHFYWRQLRDMKGSALVELMEPVTLTYYGRLCGWTLARAHARSGDPVAMASYLGGDDAFDRSITAFSERYADQNEQDYDAFVKAVRSGRLEAVEGV
jgi:hypothetical protein